MRTLLCFLALIIAYVSAQQCSTCATGCRAPYSGATCTDGVWVYPQDLIFDGAISINCPIRVSNSATFRPRTALNFVPCGRIAIGRDFIAPEGVAVNYDLQGQSVSEGHRLVLGSFGGAANGYIGNIQISNVGGTGAIPTINPRATNGEMSLLFSNNAGNNDALNGNLLTPRGGSTNGDFDANGDRIRKCPTFTCTNPTVCNPVTPTATCDQTTGEWVVSGSISVSSASIHCPIRVENDFTVTNSLTIGGCASIRVRGTARLTGVPVADASNNNNAVVRDDQGISATFDFDAFGRPRTGERINWLQAGTLVGGLAGWNANNIWDATNSVDVAQQKCNNAISAIFFPTGQTAPASNCNPIRTQAVDGDVEDHLPELTSEFDAAVSEDDFVADTNNDDEFAAAMADVADEEFVSNEETDFAVADASDEEFFADAALADVSNGEEEFAEVFDEEFDAALGDVNEDEVIESFNDMAVDSADNSAAPSSRSDNSAPGYAYGLFVLGALILVALVVVQVQIIRVKRARESSLI